MQGNQEWDGYKTNRGIMVGYWNHITLHYTIFMHSWLQNHLFAQVLLGYEVKCFGAPKREWTLLDFAQSCRVHKVTSQWSLTLHAANDSLLSLSHCPLSPSLSLSLSLFPSLSGTSVTNWRELHTNCVSLWQCSLPASQSACVFSPIKPHCCIITVGPHLLSWYFLVTLQCSNTCRRHGGWKEGRVVKYLYASWVDMRWDGTCTSHF